MTELTRKGKERRGKERKGKERTRKDRKEDKRKEREREDVRKESLKSQFNMRYHIPIHFDTYLHIEVFLRACSYIFCL